MTVGHRAARLFVLAAAIHLLLARDAQAYLDPGAVSSFFQVFVAAMLGSLFVLKSRWRRLLALGRRRLSSKVREAGGEDEA